MKNSFNFQRVSKIQLILLSTAVLLSTWLAVKGGHDTLTPIKKSEIHSPPAQPQVNPQSTPSVLLQPPIPTEEFKTADIPGPNTEVFNEDMFKKLEDKNAPLSAVCKSLGKIDRKQNAAVKAEEFSDRFKDSVLGRSSDPAFASVQPIVRYVLKDPALKRILGRESEEKTGLDGDASVRALLMYRALLSNRQQLEHVLNQSYLLLMLGRTVERNPELAKSPQVKKYCNAIETELNDLKPVDFSEEKRGFLEFLHASNIEPASIGFDPEYKTDIDIELDGDSYSYQTGWLTKLIAAQ